MNAAVLYVYYKVPAERHAALLPQVRALCAQLQARHPGLAATLLQRPEAPQGVETWMEAWQHPQGVGDALAAAIAEAAAAAGLPQPRHAERFIPLADATPGPDSPRPQEPR